MDLTLSAQDGYEFFGTVSANLTGLVLRADGFNDQRFGVPPTVKGTRAGQPIGGALQLLEHQRPRAPEDAGGGLALGQP